MKRRQLKMDFFLVLGILLLGISYTGHGQERFGGLALYTLRDDMGTNARATLQAVADDGYKYVESADYKDGKFYGMTPKEFKETLRSVGLTPISAHMGMVTMENADQLMADTKKAGFKYFVIPVPPMGMFYFDNNTRTMGMKGTAKDLANILDALGAKAKKAGLKLLYHNHDFELKKNEEDVIVLDYLLENCNRKLVNFQMDLYWVTKAGADPVSYFNRFPKRFKIWHVKDMDDQGRFAPVSTGTIDFKRILAQKKRSGMKYYMVEQDMTFDGLKPLEAIKISHGGLKKIGFK